MTKLTALPGGKVEPVTIPNEVDFLCPDCKLPCKLWPHSKPICVQHAIPHTCRTWKQVEGKTDDVARFLIKAGVHLMIPAKD